MPKVSSWRPSAVSKVFCALLSSEIVSPDHCESVAVRFSV
jgi:hypothetical protein